MECLLPTEIARLVYGYLLEESCTEAAKMFMETSEHMKECLMFAAKGRRFNTRVLGLNLVGLLDLLAEVTCLVKTVECEAQNITRDDLLNKLKVSLKLTAQDGPTNKPVYLRFTMPSETKPARTDESLDSSPSTNAICSDELQEGNNLSSTDLPNVSAERKFQVLLENKALHEKLAENINRVVANKSDAADSLEKVLEKKIVETIINTTEQDPFFEEMLEELVGNTIKDIEKSADCKQDENELKNSEDDHTQRLPSVEEGQKVPSDREHAAPFCILERALRDSGVTSPKVLPQKPSQPKQSSETFKLQRMPNVPATVPQFVPVTAASKPLISGACVPSTIRTITCNPPLLSVRESSPVIISCASPSTANLLRTASASNPDFSRCRTLSSKQPVQSSIRILSKSPHQTLPGSSIVSILPKPPLQRGDPTTFLEEKSTPPQPQPPPSVIRVFPHSDSLGFRVGGVRTRGGKSSKCYRGQKKILHSKQNQDMSQNEQNNKNAAASVQGLSPALIPEPQLGKVMATISVALSPTGQTSIITTKTPSADQASSGPKGTVANGPDVVTGSMKNHLEEDVVPSGSSPTPTSQCENVPAIASSAPKATVSIPSDVTPEQTSEPKMKLQKRLSLTSPRKASHVRTLEFSTPPRGYMQPKRSLTSPKGKGPIRRNEININIEHVKKGPLFKSPDKSNELNRNEKREKKAWDADLRGYAGEDDVLTSVQLKRVSPPPLKEAGDMKQPTPSKTGLSAKKNTNDDLVSQIKKDVLDVIGEENLTDFSSNSPDVKSYDSVNSPPKTSKSPIRSPGSASVLEIGDIGLTASAIKRLYDRTPSRDENSCAVDLPLSKAPKVNLFLSPSNTVVFNTPNKVVLTPGKSPSLTPNSLSLEATLIKECSRIESEGMERAREQSETRSSQQQVETSNLTVRPESTVTTSGPFLQPPVGSVDLKTPAKSDVPVPVEMTPLSKIINEETRLAKLHLLTPTIPPTPDHEESKNRSPEEIESPPDMIASQRTLKETSTLRISPKAPSKTPIIRLKNTTGSSQKRKRSNKKVAVEIPIPANQSQLIAECLKNVKNSVFGTSKPKSRVRSRFGRTDEKEQPSTVSKRKPIERKKLNTSSTKISKELEIIEQYEKKVGRLPSTTSEEEELVDGLPEKSSVTTSEVLSARITADVGPEKASSFVKSEVKGGFVEQGVRPGASEGHSEIEVPKEDIASPDKSPVRNEGDLNTFRYSFIVQGESHCLSASPFMNLFELPNGGDTRLSTSSKQRSDRKKRRLPSESSDDDNVKRKRIEDDRRRYPGPSFRSRRRGRGPRRGRGSYRIELSCHSYSRREHRVDFDRRRRSPSFSDEEDRRGHSRSSSKSGQRSRSRTESGDRPSSHRSRSDNRSRGSLLSGRKSERSNYSHQSSAERTPASLPTQTGKSCNDSPCSSTLPSTKQDRAEDLEEGELSDASLSTVFSFTKKSQVVDGVVDGRLSSPAADENRQALLQNVDLDHFLSIVHGEAK